MARAKGWIWLSLALVCAVSAGGLTYFLLQQQNQKVVEAVNNAQGQVEAQQEPTVMIPVATSNLERGTVLAPDMFAAREFPVSLVPTSALTDTELLDGQVLAQSVAQGDIFRPESLYGGAGAPLSSEIESGRTVIAFPAEDLLGATGLLVEGDRIDLLISSNIKDRETQEDLGQLTGYTVQNVRVMRILSAVPTAENPNPVPKAFLLELDPADAVMVKAVKDTDGTLDLALRSPVDTDAFEEAPVTEDDIVRLMTRFGAPDTVGSAP